MKNLLPFLLLIPFLSGCSIGERIERREDRLVGSWIIEKASFDEDGSLFRRNVTEDFRNDVVTFFPDNTLEYRAGNGERFDGFWFIDALRDRDDDLEFTIDADFFFPRSDRLAFRWIGTIDKLTENNFNIWVQELDGRLRMRWDRI